MKAARIVSNIRVVGISVDPKYVQRPAEHDDQLVHPHLLTRKARTTHECHRNHDLTTHLRTRQTRRDTGMQVEVNSQAAVNGAHHLALEVDSGMPQAVWFCYQAAVATSV